MRRGAPYGKGSLVCSSRHGDSATKRWISTGLSTDLVKFEYPSDGLSRSGETGTWAPIGSLLHVIEAPEK